MKEKALSKLFWALFIIVTLWKILLAGYVEPCEDEKYYFFWSLFPQLSYFDHPPLVAWAMTASGCIFGDSIWTIRIWPLIAGTIFTLTGRALARQMFSPLTGDLAGIFLLLTPAFAGNGLLMTPDTLFAPAWAATLFFTWKAFNVPERKWLWVLIAGVSAGLGFLSKYNMILYFAGLGLLWILSPGRRSEVFMVCAGCAIIAFIFFLPVVIWNSQNDWISFSFQLKHGFSDKAPKPWITIPEYIGALLIVATPFMGVLSFHSSAKAIRSESFDKRFLASFFWIIVTFFAVSSFKRSVGPNWPMLAFFPAFILTALEWQVYPQWFRKLSFSVLAIAILAGLLGFTYFAMPANMTICVRGKPVSLPRMNEFTGGKALADAVTAKMRETKADFVCVTRHQMLGELAFFAPELRNRLWLEPKGHTRFPWIDNRQWEGCDALIIVKSSPFAINSFFRNIEEAGSACVVDKGIEKKVRFYIGREYIPDPYANGTGEIH